MTLGRDEQRQLSIGLTAVWCLVGAPMLAWAAPPPPPYRLTPTLAPVPHCPEGCPSHLWPRVIVGVLPPAGSDKSDLDLVRVRFVDQQGTVFEGNPRGCPDLPGVVCSFSFFSSPADQIVTLQVTTVDAEPLTAEARIPLGPFNYCGEDMAYVTVTFDPGGHPKIHPGQWVSACTLPSSEEE